MCWGSRNNVVWRDHPSTHEKQLSSLGMEGWARSTYMAQGRPHTPPKLLSSQHRASALKSGATSSLENAWSDLLLANSSAPQEPSQHTQETTPKHQVPGNRGHCTAGHYRTSSTSSHSFQGQERQLTFLTPRKRQRARQTEETEEYVPNEKRGQKSQQES